MSAPTNIFNQLPSSASSRGNQIKWYSDGYFYKQDLLGYEGLSEVLAYRLAIQTNLTKYGVTQYELVKHHGKICCRSKSYNPNNHEEQSLLKLLTRYYSTDLDGVYKQYFETCDTLTESFYDFVRMTVLQAVGFDIKDWLALILRFDWLILNEDRHFRNLAFIKQKFNFIPAPIFDNGAGFLSDMITYPSDCNISDAINGLQAKPFSSSFVQQVNLVEEYATETLQFTSNTVKLKVSDLAEFYSKHIINRVCNILEAQLKRMYPHITLIWS